MRTIFLLAVLTAAGVSAADALPLCTHVRVVPQTILCPTGTYSVCTATLRCLTGTTPGSVVATLCTKHACAGAHLPKT